MQVKELLKDIFPLQSSDENVGRCRGVEIPCLTNFPPQDKLEISIYLSWDKSK